MRKSVAALVCGLLSGALTASYAPPGVQASELGRVAVAVSLQDACSAASQLVAKNPAQALELIEKIRGGYAPQESLPRTDCEAERLAALKKLGDNQHAQNQAAPSNAVIDTQQRWDTFLKEWVLPGQATGLAWSALVLALLLLSRLFVFLPYQVMPLQYLPWRHASRWLRAGFLIVGIVLVLYAPSRLVVDLLEKDALKKGEAIWNLVGWTVVALLGSFLLATWMASRQRLSVEVRQADGKLNETETSYFIALLKELGGYRPRGLEIPRGTDATGLSSVGLSSPLGNGILNALQKTFESMFSVSPWHVAVDGKSKDLVSVVVTRNGWSAGAVAISTSNKLIFTDQEANQADSSQAPDLAKMAAAFVVSTLAQHYQGYRGLGGATNWRSIGLQYLATTDYEGKEDHQIQLLSRAVELDPGNLPAEAALRNLAYRRSQKEEAAAFAQWLSTVLALHDASWRMRLGRKSLLNRMRFNYLCVALNGLAGSGASHVVSPEEAEAVAVKLLEGVGHASDGEESLEKRLRPHAALFLYEVLRHKKEKDPTINWKEEWKRWYAEAETSKAPHVAFNHACSLASQNEAWKLVKTRLDAAVMDPHFKKVAPNDPVLTAYAAGSTEANRYLKLLKTGPKKNWLSTVGAWLGS